MLPTMTNLLGRAGLALVMAWVCGCSSTAKDGGLGGAGGAAGAASGFGGNSVIPGGAGNLGAGGLLPGDTCPLPVTAACGLSLCGNGVRDQCTTTWSPGSGPCPARQVTEGCDGTDLGSDSCAAHGFTGGTLACSSDCVPNTAACTECLPIGDGLVRCGTAVVATDQSAEVALGASGAEVGLALADSDPDASYPPWRIRFLRLSSALDLISTTTLEAEGGSLAVSPLADGWVVAAAVEEGLVLHTLDAHGQKVARTVVAENGRDASSWDASIVSREARNPRFAARPDGGPLLVWQTSTGVRAAVISPDGRSATAPVDVVERDSNTLAYPVAAYVDGAFSVIDKARLADGAQLIRVGTDGHVISTAKILDGATVTPAELVAAGSSLHLIYDAAVPGPTIPKASDQIMFQSLSANGAAIGSPVPLANLGDYQTGSSAVALGDDTMVLLNGRATSQLAVARLGADGHVGGAIRQLAKGPIYRYQQIVKRGPDVIVGWHAQDGQRHWLGLARFTP
jgi:hypothetical protein